MTEPFIQPPLVSAACELRFMPSDKWDMAVPGLVWDKLKNAYPEKRQDTGFETGVVRRPDGLEQTVTQTDWLTMFRHDDDATVQVTRDRLLVTRGKPYLSWSVFRDEISFALGCYEAATQPKGLLRIGLRYVNQIDIPETVIELEDYLDFYPASGKGLPDTFGAFLVSADYPFGEGDAVLRLRLAPAPRPDDKTTSLALDLDYFTSKPPQYDLTSCLAWLEAAHDRVESAFLAALKPPLILLFGSEKRET